MNYLNLLAPGPLVGILFITSCNYIELPHPDLADTVTLSATTRMIRADIVMNEYLTPQIEPSYLEGEGSMTGTDIEGNQFLFNCFVTMSHQALFDEYQNTLIQEGRFRMKNTQGDIIHGKYSGGGRDEGNGIVIGLVLSVTGGTGKFELAKGALHAEWIPASDEMTMHEITYNGKLMLPEDE